MNVQFTARHFKARPELQQFAEDSVQGLSSLYDGIVDVEVILEEESHSDGGKRAEIKVNVYKDQLFAKDRSNDFAKSISGCVEKLERQLTKYKAKLHEGQHPHEKPEFITDEE